MLGAAFFYSLATVRLGNWASKAPALRLAASKSCALTLFAAAWLGSYIFLHGTGDAGTCTPGCQPLACLCQALRSLLHCTWTCHYHLQVWQDVLLRSGTGIWAICRHCPHLTAQMWKIMPCAGPTEAGCIRPKLSTEGAA